MNLSIRARLTASILAVVMLIVAFQVWYFPRVQELAAMEALESKARSVAQLVAHQTSTPLDMGYIDQADEVLVGALQDRDLVSLALYTPPNIVFAAVPTEASPAPEPWPNTLTVTHEPRGLRVAVPMTTRNGDHGLLIARYSTQVLVNQRTESMYRAVVLGLMVLVVGLLLAWLVANSFSRRVSVMATAIQTVARGKLDVRPVPDADQDELGDMARALNTMLASLRDVELSVKRLGTGDLSRRVEGVGDLAEALNRTIDNQRELVRRLTGTASAIQAVATEILDASERQAAGAGRLASVVDATTHRMDLLHASGERIADSSLEVLDDADQTHADTLIISSRIYQLTAHSERIDEILDAIRDIASKSELLTINAALEGTRAGEAGRGFSLVASQMHRVTEQIVSALRDIQDLNDDIHAAMSGTVHATAEMTARASSTAQAARRIREIIQAQADVTGDVTTGMAPVGTIVRNAVTATRDNVHAARSLQDLSARLDQLVTRFVTADERER